MGALGNLPSDANEFAKMVVAEYFEKRRGAEDGVCEVCGTELEPDPESSEDHCPECDE